MDGEAGDLQHPPTLDAELGDNMPHCQLTQVGVALAPYQPNVLC